MAQSCSGRVRISGLSSAATSKVPRIARGGLIYRHPELWPSGWQSVVSLFRNVSCATQWVQLILLLSCVLLFSKSEEITSIGRVNDFPRMIATSFLQNAKTVDEMKVVAIAEIVKYCHRYPFIKCKIKEGTNEFEIHANSFGAGVTAKILNNPSFGIKVFENCPAMANHNIAGELTNQCYVDPLTHPEVEVFLKILQETADLSNTMSTDTSMSAFEKECRRARAAARLRLPPPVNGHISPPYYDIMDTRTNRPHDIQQHSYMQGFLNAETADGLRGVISEIERDTLYGQLAKLVKRLEEVKSGRLQENAFQSQVETAKKEIWMRFRLWVKLLDTVFVAAWALWEQNILHCDLHFGNIMLIKSYITDASTLIDICTNGEGIVPKFQHYYSKRIVTRAMKRELSKVHANGKVGVEVFLLHPSSVRLIDTAYMVSYGSNMYEYPPCLFYRAQREEDLNELWRGGMDFIFNKQKPNILQFVQQKLTEQYREKWRTLEGQRRNELESIYQVWHVSRAMLKGLGSTVLQNVPELASCQAMAKAKGSNRLLSNLLKDRNKRQEASQQLAAKCSFAMQRSGLMKLRQELQNALNQVPKDAMTGFGLEQLSAYGGASTAALPHSPDSQMFPGSPAPAMQMPLQGISQTGQRRFFPQGMYPSVRPSVRQNGMYREAAAVGRHVKW